MIAASRPSAAQHGAPGALAPGAVSKLPHVSERFAALYSDLEAGKLNRENMAKSKFQQFSDTVDRLEKGLEAEVHQRATSNKQIQEHFEGELKALCDRMAAQHSEMQALLREGIGALDGRLQELQVAVREEREARRTDVEQMATSLIGKVDQCVGVLDEERSNRAQEQTTAINRFGEELTEITHRIEIDKATRGNEISILRSEMAELMGARNESDEKFRAMSVEELGALKAALQLEREERISEDDEIVQAINDYTRALQDGLKLVGE